MGTKVLAEIFFGYLVKRLLVWVKGCCPKLKEYLKGKTKKIIQVQLHGADENDEDAASTTADD
jgi:hypothetical protein